MRAQGADTGRIEWGKLAFIGMMYIATVFPAGFTSSFVSTLFRAEGMDLKHFWIFALPSVPYWLRWAWAPVVDSYWIRSLGRRRSWIIPCTILTTAAYCSLAAFEPVPSMLWAIVSILILKSIFASTQEVAIDAYVVDNVTARERPAASGINVIFEAVGQVAAVAGLGLVMQLYGWQVATVLSAALMLLFLLPVILRREPPMDAATEAALRRGPPTIAHMFAPLGRFARRLDTWVMAPVLFVGGLYTGAIFPMLGPFLVDLQFEIGEIGLISGAVLAGAALLGAVIAITAGSAFGARPVLLVVTMLVLPSMAPVWWMAHNLTQLSIPLTIAALFLPCVMQGVFYVLFMSVRIGFASRLQAGTDFSSMAAITRVAQTAGAAMGGPIAAAFGWDGFFALVGVLGLLAGLGLALPLNLVNRLVAARDARELGRQPAPNAPPLPT